MMLYILLTVTVLIVVSAVVVMTRAKAVFRENKQLRAVVDHQDDYTFLVNNEFVVEKSNFDVRRQQSPDEPPILGNVLHCRNAHEAGRCGESEACGNCPVRFVITKSFERGDDFKGLEACMEVYDDDQKLVDMDVQLNGHYVNLGRKGHMVINVKDVTERKDSHLPKVLFVSENAPLFDKVRMALEQHFRVLCADNLHQAMHRLLMAADYHFYAIVTDEAFFSKNDAVTTILVKNIQIPVFVFTSEITSPLIHGDVRTLKIDVEPETLLQKLLEASVA